MLDKKVIRFTRNGMEQDNLTTGESMMLTKSDFAKEIKYGVLHESIYHAARASPSADTENYPEHVNPAVLYQRARQVRADKNRIYHLKPKAPTTAFGADVGSSSAGRQVKRFQGISCSPALIHKAKEKAVKDRYTEKQQYKRYSESYKQVQARQNTSFLKSVRPGRIAADTIMDDMEKSDNFALQAMGGQYRIVDTAASVYRKFSSSKNSGYAAAKQAATARSAVSSAYTAEAVQRRAATAAAVRNRIKERTAKAAVSWKGKAAESIIKKIAAVAVKAVSSKGALIIIGCILLVVIISQSADFALNGVVGSTQSNPELEAYVQQLDSDFINRVQNKAKSFGNRKHYSVTIKGLEDVHTDANALAIVTTSEWVVIDLTPENKQRLLENHKILNTYEVEDKTEKRSKSNSGKKESYTVHKITITVHVYHPEEKLDSFGLQETQKAQVAEQLTLLSQIQMQSGGDQELNADDVGDVSAGNGTYIWPVPGHIRISSGYGYRADPLRRISTAFHQGIDIPAPFGTPVLAAANGTVIRAGWDNSYGNFVKIQHTGSIQTLYGHNSRLLVKVGDKVKQGQRIALIGSTGDSTGNHCHFEIRKNGRHTDPIPYLRGETK